MPRDPLLNRVADLERELASLRREIARSHERDGRLAMPPAIRWAKTVATGEEEEYPEAVDTPNTYPIVLVDPAADAAAGQQAVTTTNRQEESRDTVTNLADGRTTIGIYHYLPVGTVVPVWRYRGRWWTNWQTSNIFPVTIDAPLGSGAAADVTLPDGRVVNATNQSGVGLNAGAATVYQAPHNKQWYLVGGGGGSGGSSVWSGIVLENVAPNATGDVLLSDPSLGTAGVVTAKNWTSGHYAHSGTRVVAWRDPYDNLYYFRPDALRLFIGTIDTTFDADVINGFNVASVQSLDGGANPPAPPPFGPPLTGVAVDNPFKLVGRHGDLVLFVQSPGTTTTKYTAIKVLGQGVRWFKALLSAALSSEDGTATVDTIVALDGGTVPTITAIQNAFALSGQNDAAVLFCSDWSQVDEDGDPSYLLCQVQHLIVTVVTDYRYDTSSHKLQKKTRRITVMHEEDESEWLDVQTFTGYQAVTDVDFSSPHARKKTRLLFAPEAGTESDWSNWLTFTQIDVIADTMVESGVLKHSTRTALVVNPGTASTETVFTPPTQSVVINVFDGTTYLGQTKATLSVWAIAEGSSSLIATIDVCP